MTTPYSQGFRLLYRHSRRRLEIPCVGPIIAALKRLKLATVTTGATSTLSASSDYLFLCRFSDAFSCFPHPRGHQSTAPSDNMLYQTSASSAVALPSPVMLISERSSAMQSMHYVSSPSDPRFPAFSSSPDMTLLGNLWSLMRSSVMERFWNGPGLLREKWCCARGWWMLAVLTGDTWNLVLSLYLSNPHHGHTLVTYTHQHPTILVGSTRQPTRGLPNKSPEKQTS